MHEVAAGAGGSGQLDFVAVAVRLSGEGANNLGPVRRTLDWPHPFLEFGKLCESCVLLFRSCL